MKPRSNHSELPGTMVTASATQPPVHDSAVTSIQPLAFRAWPASTASLYSSESKPTSDRRRQQLEQREANEGEERSHQVINHDAESAAELRLDVVDRPGF